MWDIFKRKRDPSEDPPPRRSPAPPLTSSEAKSTSYNAFTVAHMAQDGPGDQMDSSVANSSLRDNLSCPVANPSMAHGLAYSAENEPWTGFKLLTDLLRRTSDEFVPLKSAFEALSECTSILEAHAQAHGDYKQLRNNLDQLFRNLVLCFDRDVPPSMTPVINSLARGIEQEAELVMQKQRRSGLSRVTRAQDDIEEVMKCYQRIQGLIERLALNVDLSIWRIVEEQAAIARIERLPFSPAADHKSAQSDSFLRTVCTPNTRVDVLEQIQSWAANEAGRKVYWLNGMAGTGKTTIAYSLCENLSATRKLAASFFCTRQLPECRDVNRIIPSIAYQLSKFSRPFRHALASILMQNSDAHNQPLSEQFRSLLVIPIQKVERSFPLDLVVVIDALDECESSDGVGRMLKVLLGQSSNLPVKFFVTSRPEPRILDEMHSELGARLRTELRLHELDRAIVQGDIKTYLTSELGKHVELLEVEQLANRSGVLFIYAATAVRYISYDNFSRSAERLRRVLAAPTLQRGNGSRDIDALYTTILEAALENEGLEADEKEEMLLVLQDVVCAQEPLTVGVLAGMLGLISTGPVNAALRPLRSVLQVWDDSGLVTTLHESFPDFLQDRARSNRYYCDTQQHHADLAKRCFDLVKVPNPPFNICNLNSSYLLDTEVSGLDTRIQNAISQQLWYACRYWAAHLERAGPTLKLITELELLILERFLLWVEIMNLKQQAHYGARVLYRLKGWLEKCDCPSYLRPIVQDCWRFVTGIISSPIARSTPHIYVSALPLWPRSWPVSWHYRSKFPRLVQATGTAMSKRIRARVLVYDVYSTVGSIAYSPDGLHLASGSNDNTVRIWDACTGQSAGLPLEGHTEKVTSVAYSPDGTRIASGSYDKTICIWDARTGQPVGLPIKGHSGFITSVAYSPDGAYIASGSDDMTVRIWNAHTGQPFGLPFRGHTARITSVAYSHKSSYIASGSFDKTVRIWDAHTGQPVGRPLKGHAHWVTSVAYSPDSTYIASGSYDRSIHIWDTHAKIVLGLPLKGHMEQVTSVSCSPNCAYILSGSSDKTVRIWDVRTGQQIGPPLTGHKGSVLSVTYSPDGAYIASGSDDKTLHIRDSQTDHSVHFTDEDDTTRHTSHTGDIELASIGSVCLLQPCNIGVITSVAYSPDGAYVALGSHDQTLRIWDAHTGQLVGLPFEGHTGYITSIAYSPDGAYITSGSSDKTVRIWDARTGQPAGLPLEGHEKSITSVAYSPNGAYIASGSNDRTMRIWDVRNRPSLPLECPAHSVTSLAYSLDGAYIASGSDHGTVYIWDALTGEQAYQPLEGHTGQVTSVAYSSNSAYVVSGSSDKTVRVWDARTGQQVRLPFIRHTGPVTSVTYSPDSRYIASCSDDNTVRIWDVNTGQSTSLPLEGHVGWVRSVVYSSDGANVVCVVSGAGNMAVRVLDACNR